MNDYHRQVIACLRDEYGVRIGVDDLQYGGKNHPYLEFDFAGKSRRITLQHSVNSRNNTLEMKLRDIRHELGPPPERPTKQRRKMESMMPEPFNNPFTRLTDIVKVTPLDEQKIGESRQNGAVDEIIRIRGTMSNHKSNGCLYFAFPQEVANQLDVSIRYGVVSTRTDCWEIKPGGNSGLRRAGKSRQWCVAVSSVASGLAGDLGYFSRYPADYTVVDGRVLVSLVERKSLRPSIERKKKVIVQEAREGYDESTLTQLTPSPQVITLLNLPSTSVVKSLDDRMRAFLRELMALETGTPYRLIKVKTDGDKWKWKFKAPSVQLEDEG